VKISQDFLESKLVEAGFFCPWRKRNIFLVNESLEIAPAFIPRILRRDGRIQVSGGMGIFFNEFEERWRATLTKEEVKVDKTLPLIISIENFAELNDAGVFIYTDDSADVEKISNILFLHCSMFPKSVEELKSSISCCRILGKSVSQYLHYFSCFDDSNIYFKKSASFVFWLQMRWPELGEMLLSCVEGYTRSLIVRNRREV